MLRIDLAPLSDGLHHLELEPAAEALDLDPDTFSDIRVQVVLDYRNGRALVTLHVTGVAVLECDRTLATFAQGLDGSYRVLFVPPDFGHPREADDEVGEVRLLEPGTHEIDLTGAVRDTLLLAVPVRKVAPGADDVELPTRFGAEADTPAVDPRWEALRALHTGEGSPDA